MSNIIYLDELVSDIIKIIYDQLDFVCQVNLRLVSMYFAKYPITNLFDNVPNKYNLTDTILTSYPFITKLNINYNTRITDINHLTNLQILSAWYDCGIDLNGIKLLNDHKINNICIMGLTNLTELNIIGNEKITNINHLINLRTLNAGWQCGLDNIGIMGLTNLTELNVTGNEKITNVNHLVNLRILCAGWSCGINNMGIIGLTNLTELNIFNNDKIINIDHLKNLLMLTTAYDSKIDIKLLTKLEVVNGKKIDK
jgi:hypothetical protein